MGKTTRVPNVLVNPLILACLLLLSALILFGASLLLPLSAFASSYSEAVEADEPLAYWTEYNSTSGSIPDLTGDGYGITGSNLGSDISSGPVSPTGSASIAFAGNTGNNGAITPLTRSDVSNWSNGWAWEYWFKSDQLTGYWNPDSSGQSQYGLVLTNADNHEPRWDGWATGLNTKSPYTVSSYRFQFSHGGDESVQLNPPAPSTSWHHIVLSVEPGKADYYIDGTLAYEYTGTQPNLNKADLYQISTYKGDNWPNGNWSSLRGYMSDIAIYNHALTEEQVKEHYDLGSYEFSMQYPEVMWTRAGSSAYHNTADGEESGEPFETGETSGWHYTVAEGFSMPGELTLNSTTGAIEGSPHSADEVNSEYHKLKIAAAKGGQTVLSNEFTLVILPSEPQQQLRPILLFDSGEKWRPLNVNDFLQEDFGGEQPHHELCKGGGEGECVEVTGEGTLIEHNSDEWGLNVHGSSADDGDFHAPGINCEEGGLCDSDTEGALYWHPVQQREDDNPEGALFGPKFYDYWAYYRYNQFELPGGLDGTGDPPNEPGTGDHESDFEGLTVASNSESDDPTGFNWVGMDGHGVTWHYLSGTLYCDYDEEIRSCLDGPDGVKGQRVMAYVAKGDHATYPRPCHEEGETVCNQTSDDEDGEANKHLSSEGGWTPYPSEQEFNGEDPWALNDTSSVLLNLEEAPWATWEGNWSVLEGGPHGPLFQSRAIEPWEAYANCTERYTTSGDDCEAAEDTARSSAFTLSDCSSWEGPFVQAAICDPEVLAKTMRRGNFGEPGLASLVAGNSTELTDSAPGITQLVRNEPLAPGEIVNVEGQLSEQDQITLNVEVAPGEVQQLSVTPTPGTRAVSAIRNNHRFKAHLYRHHRRHHRKIIVSRKSQKPKHAQKRHKS